MINVTRSSMPPFEEYMEEIKPLWDSRWLTNMSAKHRQLQAALETFLQCPHVTLYTNGHLALECALASFGFPIGAEVITTPFTFASTTHAIVRNGLTPVFCDIDPQTYTMDAQKIEPLISEKTAALLPVHVYGNLCEVDKLQALADKYNLKLIYDAAHAFGVTHNGVSSANFGDVSMFSFHATKVFHTIEGGALCYRDAALTPLLNALKNFGIQSPEDIDYIGGNAKMNEFQAAMGLCNLRHFKDEIGKRKLVYDRYVERLSNCKGIRLSAPQDGVTPNYAYFPVVFDGYRKTRDDVFCELKAKDILTRKYFYPLTNDCAAYKDYPTSGTEKTPVAARVASRVLTLPMYADLALDDVDRICDIVLE